MKQTKITKEIIQISKQFNGKDLNTLKEVLFWLKRNLRFDPKFAKKRSRTADEILRSKISTGCIDTALAFIGLAKTLEFKVTFVDCVMKDWLIDKNPKNTIRGHIFCKVFIKEKIFIVNPTEGTISNKKIYLNRDKEYVPLKEGDDSWDIGFEDTKDQAKFLEKNYNISFNL